jgi:NDP-sugar pyrophosphorylase family protein
MQAMIFAAGLGTRLKPLTDTMPKALVPVGGKPLLWHVITRLKQAGATRIVVNVHHLAKQIIDYLSVNHNFGLELHISDESENLLDTGGGIRKARHMLDPSQPVLIHNVDILSNANLASLYHAATTSQADALLLVSPRQTKRYLLFSHDRRLQGWTNVESGEVRSPYPTLDLSQLQRLAFSGIHVIAPRMLTLMDDMPQRFGIVDFYLKHCHSSSILAFEQPGLKLLDVGKLNTLAEAEQFLN